MLLNPMGGIMMTNVSNDILQDTQLEHPAATSMIEISRTRMKRTGMGLCGEKCCLWLSTSQSAQMHPTVVLSAYRMALHDMISILKKASAPAGVNNRDTTLNIIDRSITTKVIGQWFSLACSVVLDAVQTVHFKDNGQKEIGKGGKATWEHHRRIVCLMGVKDVTIHKHTTTLKTLKLCYWIPL